MDFLTQIQEYRPCCEQETIDRERILSLAKWFSEMILTRDCELAHITGSGMIFNPKRDHVLMVYHNLYKSWSWTGGHADGEPDQLSVALREAKRKPAFMGSVLWIPALQRLTCCRSLDTIDAGSMFLRIFTFQSPTCSRRMTASRSRSGPKRTAACSGSRSTIWRNFAANRRCSRSIRN